MTNQLSITNSSGELLNWWIVGPGYTNANIVSSGTLASSSTPGSISLPAGTQLRIYFSSKQIFTDQPAGEPSGWTISDPFSFYEYTLSGTNLSGDISYINDWAYPIQSTVNGVKYGFLNATAVAQAMASAPPDTFIATSAASGKGVGTVSDLFDNANQRFAGPQQLWQQQVLQAMNKWAYPLGNGTIYTESWITFLLDVPYGPGGNPSGWISGTEPSGNASQLNQNDQYPEYGFDFSTNLNWSTMNGGLGASIDEPSGEKFYADNYNVWNFGVTGNNPSLPTGNIAPDGNSYTQILRKQASDEGGMNLYSGDGQGGGNPNFVGFYTYPKDDYNANYQADISEISLTIGTLANGATTGTSYRDVITGSSQDDIIVGGYGGDRLSGSASSGRSSAEQRGATASPSDHRHTLQVSARGGKGTSAELDAAAPPPSADDDRTLRSTPEGGRDRFRYLRADSSLRSKGMRDVITDFGSDDLMELAMVDADATKPGQQRFRWIGDDEFKNRAGQLRIQLGYAFRGRDARPQDCVLIVHL
ncbi:MAG: hypothetical protein ACKO5F_09985 [Synechococcus sp.]